MRVILSRLASLAGFAVVLCCGWLAAMELILRHPGYVWRFVVAAAIVAQAALTIAVLEDLIDVPALRWPLAAVAAATGVLGGWIVAEDLSRPGLPSRPHFEGYLLLIGLAVIAYGLLTTAAIGVQGRNHGER